MELLEFKLEDKLFDNFNLNVSEVIPHRKVFLLKTDQGEKYLKKIDYPAEELYFIYDSLTYISKKFKRIVSFYKTKNGEIYTNYKGSNYVVLNNLQGREGSFLNPVDITYMTEAIRELHSASIGIRNNLSERNRLGLLIKNLKDKLSRLELFYNMAVISDTNFSKLFTEYYGKYKREADKSVEVLEKSEYYKLCSDVKCIAFNHHDLAHHNLIINEDKAYFIDFDYSIIDLRIHDISNFINKTNRSLSYDFEKSCSILADYSKENPLSSDEMRILFGMLLFPSDIYNLAYSYYSRNKLWKEEIFLNKLKEKTDKIQFREIFLNEFQKKL